MIGISPTRFNWHKLTTQAPTDLGGHSGTTIIRNKKFTNPDSGEQFGDNIVMVGGSGTLIVQGCYFGASAGIGMDIEDFTGTLIVENCLFANNKAGIFLGNCTLSNSRIRYNQCINPHGARLAKGQFVQLANGCNVPGLAIEANKIESFLGEGYTEDLISAFGGTSGSSGNPFQYIKNFARGGGPSDSGGGFMLGDTGGSWGLNEYNKVQDPGNYTFAIAGGQNNIVRNNIASSNRDYGSFISCYVYETTDVGTCSNHTMEDNQVYIPNGNYFYRGTGGETCGSIVGVSDGGDDNDAFELTNTKAANLSAALATLDFPDRLIDMVDEDTLWRIRAEIEPYRHDTPDGGWPATPNWPIANSEADKSISIDNTTITSTGSSGGSVYNWVLVSGPNKWGGSPVILTNTTTATLSVSNMVDGEYLFRLEYYDSDGAGRADWTTVTVNLL